MRLFLHQAENYTKDQIAHANAFLKKVWISVLSTLFALIAIVVLFAACHWYIALSILASIIAIGGTYLCSRAEPVLGAYALKALGGLPDIKIGEVVAAFFKSDVKLPNIDLKKLNELGFGGTKDVFRVWAYIYMGIGIFIGILTMLELRNPAGLFVAFAALFLLAAWDFSKPGSGEYFLKIAKAVGVAELVYGLLLAFFPSAIMEAKLRTVGVNIDYPVPADISRPTFLTLPIEGELYFKVVGEKRLHVVRRDGGVDEYYDLKRTDKEAAKPSLVWNYPGNPPYVPVLGGASEAGGGTFFVSPENKGVWVGFNSCNVTNGQFQRQEKSVEKTSITFRLWRPWLAW
ncbi:MAG: hypothetical protein HGA38_00170 [Candidatus Moranbacteria bacterium]|nr:hypothetical protein [Candidatus Moranbacteria bacterium]